MIELLASICFLLALQGLSDIKHARYGNWIAIAGMSIAVFATLLLPGVHRYGLILVAIAFGGGIGVGIAKKIPMMALPQLIAAFHSLVGLAAVFVAGSCLHSPQVFRIGIPGTIKLASLIEMGIGTVIGAITFSGSLVAFGKLQGLISGKLFVIPHRSLMTMITAGVLLSCFLIFISTQSVSMFWIMNLIAIFLGVFLIMPIGGADMPVIVSMLNSYSGWAAAGIGFTMGHPLLITTGALVGASGAILSYVMCKGMNRSLLNVLVGGFGQSPDARQIEHHTETEFQTANYEEAASILRTAKSVIIVPGYGMAVSQAQHTLQKIALFLKSQGATVDYAIHPVAGRMPGHMNVLLAEAHVPYEDVKELEEINDHFEQTDVVIVIGANDITNPAAKRDEASPIYGMPVLDVEKSKKVLFIKRSMSPGYAGIDNALFYEPNVYMVFGDGKQVCEEIFNHLSK